MTLTERDLLAAGWKIVGTKNPFCWREPRPGFKHGGGLFDLAGAVRRESQRKENA